MSYSKVIVDVELKGTDWKPFGSIMVIQEFNPELMDSVNGYIGWELHPSD